MQDNQRPTPIRRPTRLIRYPTPSTPQSEDTQRGAAIDLAGQPTQLIETISHPSHPVTPTYNLNSAIKLSPADLVPDLHDISNQSTRLMQLSGMMRAIRIQQPQPTNQDHTFIPNNADAISIIEEEYWPNGIQQTGAFPIVNLYGSEPFGKTLPQIPVAVSPTPAKKQPTWRTWLNSPAAKITIGLLIGIGMLFLVYKYVNFGETIQVLKQNLATPRGITLALLSGVAFLTAFSIRGIRWKLF